MDITLFIAILIFLLFGFITFVIFRNMIDNERKRAVTIVNIRTYMTINGFKFMEYSHRYHININGIELTYEEEELIPMPIEDIVKLIEVLKTHPGYNK